MEHALAALEMLLPLPRSNASSQEELPSGFVALISERSLKLVLLSSVTNWHA